MDPGLDHARPNGRRAYEQSHHFGEQTGEKKKKVFFWGGGGGGDLDRFESSQI